MMTLFGVLDEIRPNDASGTSFVVYKFEGCEHASDKEREAHHRHRRGRRGPDGVGGVFRLPRRNRRTRDDSSSLRLARGFEVGEKLLWIEAVLDEEALSQTVVRIHDRYSV